MLQFTLGPLKVGHSIATFLFGLTTSQIWVYFRDFPADPLPSKILVSVVWLTELAHQCCTSQLIYWFTIQAFCDPHLLYSHAPIGLIALPTITSLSSLLVTSFLIHSLWKSTRNVLLVTLSIILQLAQLSTAVAIGILELRVTTFDEFLLRFRAIIVTSWISGAFLDVLLTMALCYDLCSRRPSALHRTSRMIDRLILWCVGTGMVTSIAVVTMTLCFCVMPTNNRIWMAIYLFLPRLYSNSLLVLLNTRHSLRHMGSTTVPARPWRSQ